MVYTCSLTEPLFTTQMRSVHHARHHTWHLHQSVLRFHQLPNGLFFPNTPAPSMVGSSSTAASSFPHAEESNPNSRNFSTVPCASIRPWSSLTTQFAAGRTRSTWCVARTTVRCLISGPRRQLWTRCSAICESTAVFSR